MPDPSNARKHDQKNLDSIKGSLAKFGQQKPIVVDYKNIVIAGNGTLAAAKELGWDEIDIVRTDLKGSELTAYGLADNRTGELASWDMEALTAHLDALKAEDFDLDSIGFDDSFFLKENNLDDFDNDKESSNKFIIEIQFPDEESMREEYDSLSEKGLMARIKNG